MESPEFLYEEMSHIDNIKDIAYERLYYNYLVLNLKGDEKMIEFNSTNQESLINQFNFGRPVPGMIYTFYYIPLELLEIVDLRTKKQFIDYAPLMFCTSANPTHMSGINMNMLPNMERLKFFKEYYTVYKEFFERVEEKTENRQIAINKRFLERSLMYKSQEMIKAFSKRQHENFNYGYRKYDMKKVKQLRMIEFEEFAYIPFYEPRDAFRKMNMKQIHTMYYRSK